jgi:hypothetical protein
MLLQCVLEFCDNYTPKKWVVLMTKNLNKLPVSENLPYNCALNMLFSNSSNAEILYLGLKSLYSE